MNYLNYQIALINSNFAFEDANKVVEDAKIAADNLEKIAQQKLNLDIEMFNLQGNSLESLLYFKRESEIKTIDTSLVALQQLIWKIGDLKVWCSYSNDFS